ncbi:MAG TPA: SLC13 family permease, partial [Nitrososphaeraceae archaeon]|nr:SLC13 family permease [Nitrososphaeraceae archaeon]
MFQNRKSTIGLLLGPLLFVLIVLLLPVDSLSFDGRIVLGITIWMSLWWITEAIPIYATAMLPLVLLPSLEVTDIGETAAVYADRIVFLFLGGFILAKAIEKTELHKRFALNILRAFGTNPRNVVAAFIIVTGFLSAWISNTATAMLMVPIAAAVIVQVDNMKQRKQFGLCLMLSIAYSASLGGLATLIGTPPNAIFASLSSSLSNVEVTFSDWMLVGMPISAVSLFVTWLYMVNIGMKINKKTISLIKEKEIIYKQLQKLGGMSADEKIVAAVFSATALMWITRGLLWKDFLPMVDDTTIVLISAITLFLLPSTSHRRSSSNTSDTNTSEKTETSLTSKEVKSSPNESSNNGQKTERLLDWNTASKIPWGVLLLIGGGLALADAFEATGLDRWIANSLLFVEELNYLFIIVIIVAITIFAGEIMSNTAAAAVFIPIAASLATAISIDPVLLMAPIAIATSYGFIMPVGTPPNAIVFGSGYVTTAKMAR